MVPASFDSLPFSDAKQLAVLGHITTNDAFFRQIRGKIEPGWFNDPYCAKIFAAKLKFTEEHGRPPTIEELAETPQFTTEEDAVKKKMQTRLNESAASVRAFPLDVLGKELSEWLKSRIYHVYVEKSADLYNQQKTEDAFGVAKEMVKKLDEARFYNDYEVTYENPVEDIRKVKQNFDKAMTIGHPLMDKIMLPEANGQGCLLPGDSTVILAPTNTGKTTFCVTVAVENIKKGKNVLFVQHEDGEENVKTKVLCAILGVNKAQLFEMCETKEGTERLFKGTMVLKRFFTHVRFVKAGATVEEVEGIYRRKQDEAIARTGKPFDIHINDYPGKLITSMARGGWMRRQIDDYVYGYIGQLGSEYGTHTLMPVQTNREGSKINSGIGPKGALTEEQSKRLLVKEDVNEAFGVPQAASNLITVNRGPVAKRRGFVTLYIDKSRSAETGVAVVCKSAYDRSITHGVRVGRGEYERKLGAFAYAGTHDITHRPEIEDLMAKYDGSFLPELLADSLM